MGEFTWLDYLLARILCFFQGHEYQDPFFGCVICERCGDWYNEDEER